MSTYITSINEVEPFAYSFCHQKIICLQCGLHTRSRSLYNNNEEEKKSSKSSLFVLK